MIVLLSRLSSRVSSLRVIGCRLCLIAVLLSPCALVAPLRTSLSWWLCLVGFWESVLTVEAHDCCCVHLDGASDLLRSVAKYMYTKVSLLAGNGCA